LGKEQMAFQELVFFMAYELKLYPPSSCEKIVSVGKKSGLLTISSDKIVTFNVAQLGKKTRSDMSVHAMIMELTTKTSLDKAFGISMDRIGKHEFKKDPGVLDVIFKSHDGKPVFVHIDKSKRQVEQENGEESEEDIERKRLSKYLTKAILLHKDDQGMHSLIEDLYNNLSKWKFRYKER
ncbi:DUF2240 family protein, partial [Candidatus Bathyarchaeota archaeon]|nr:DUF2240 family protein [Candidatus Bathyarchaeota archaeon]